MSAAGLAVTWGEIMGAAELGLADSRPRDTEAFGIVPAYYILNSLY